MKQIFLFTILSLIIIPNVYSQDAKGYYNQAM